MSGAAPAWPQLTSARSLLFVPATRPERFAKALASGADAVIIDLEDAVAPGDKDAARNALAIAFGNFSSAERQRVLVRINAAGSPWHGDDLQLLRQLAPPGLAGVVLPKAESSGELQRLTAAAGPTCALLPQIESVAGLDAVDALATSPLVLRLVFGNLDFQADAGLACDADEAELLPVRLALVLASRRAGLAAPVDGVSPNTQDSAQLQADCARSRRGGFGAKLCIHPVQVTDVNAVFTPSAAQQAWAQHVLREFQANGGGVFILDGRMIDAPVVRLAQHTLARCRPPA